MSIKNSLGLVSFVLVVGASAFGCSSSDNPGTPGNDAGTDSSTKDSSTKDSTPPGDDDGGPSDDGGATCAPASTSGFTPETFPPSKPHQGLCTTQDIAAFVAACGDNGDNTKCEAWQLANLKTDAGAGTACGACIISSKNDGGCRVDAAGGILPNYGGCYAIVDAANGAKCAASVNAASDCDAIACGKCEGTQAEFDKCISDAEAGSCSTYATKAKTDCATITSDGGAQDTCAPDPNGLDGDYTFVIGLICGGGDGGAGDAGHD